MCINEQDKGWFLRFEGVLIHRFRRDARNVLKILILSLEKGDTRKEETPGKKRRPERNLSRGHVYPFKPKSSP